MKLSKKFKGAIALTLSIAMVSAINVSTVMADDDPLPGAPDAGTYMEDSDDSMLITDEQATISAPVWDKVNMPEMDTTNSVNYWYAGNKFKALNQLDSGNGTAINRIDATLTTYAIGKEEKPALYSSCAYSASYVNSQVTTFVSGDTASDTVWELMDTNAIWDDQYLYAQYYRIPFSSYGTHPTGSFSPDILNTVERWYDYGFSYISADEDRSKEVQVEESGVSWFSDIEKTAVEETDINTDGVVDMPATVDTDTLEGAHLFAPSIDELYYNQNILSEIRGSLCNDYSNIHNGGSTVYHNKYARQVFLTRSFGGVGPETDQANYTFRSTAYGFIWLHANSLSNCECAVTPAFYLNLGNVDMARKAISGKSAIKSAGLAKYEVSNLGNSIKFMIKDATFAPGFTSSVDGKAATVITGDTYKVPYENASTSLIKNADAGNNDDSALAISAILYKGNKIAYYGPIEEVKSGSGTVSLTIPSGVTPGEYTLALFEEQLGGTSTYDTSKNPDNGSEFTGSHVYTSYETDYRSGSAAYMKLNVIDGPRTHTGVRLTNENDTDVSTGDTINTSKISGVYKSPSTVSRGAISADDIYVISAADWVGSESATNANLAASITIPDSAEGSFDYYVVVKDDSAETGYWAEKYTVTVKGTTKPDALSVDYDKAQIAGFDPNSTYTIGGTTVTPSKDGTLDIDKAWYGKEITIEKTASGSGASITEKIAIPKKADMPTGVGVVNASRNDKNDGQITSVSDKMEYGLVPEDGTGITWKDCTGDTVTGLAPGKYAVRVKVINGASFASDPVEVTIGVTEPSKSDDSSKDSDRDDDSYSTGKDDKGNTGAGTTTPTNPTTPVNPTPTTPVTPDPATPVNPTPTTPDTPDPATPATPDQGGSTAGGTDQGSGGNSAGSSGSTYGTSSSSDHNDDRGSGSSHSGASNHGNSSSSSSSSSTDANGTSAGTTDSTTAGGNQDGTGESTDSQNGNISGITASIITDATSIAQTVKTKLDNALTSILKKDSKVKTGPYVKSDSDDIKVEIPTDLQKSGRTFYLMTAKDNGDIVILSNESSEDGVFEATGEAGTDYMMIFEDGETPLAGMITNDGTLNVAADTNCYNHLIGLGLALIGLIAAALLARKRNRYFWAATAAGLALALVATATGSCGLDWIFFAGEVIVTIAATAALMLRSKKAEH